MTWVALFHFNETTEFQSNWYRHFFKIGYLGVPIFFVISGYCIALSANYTITAREFISRRFFKIFPTYWLSLLIVMLAVLFSLLVYGANSVATLPKSLMGVVATLTILTSPFSSTETVNWVYWSLTVEIFFYAIVAVGLLMKDKFRFYWIMLISILPFFFSHQTNGLLFFVKYWPAFLLGYSTYLFMIVQNWRNLLLILLSLVTLVYFTFINNYFIAVCLSTICIIIFGHFNNQEKVYGLYWDSIHILSI